MEREEEKEEESERAALRLGLPCAWGCLVDWLGGSVGVTGSVCLNGWYGCIN